MKQTRAQSAIEGTVNVAIGSGIGWAANVYVGLSWHTSLLLTFWLTVISFVRGYAVRRFFNWWVNR